MNRFSLLAILIVLQAATLPDVLGITFGTKSTSQQTKSLEAPLSIVGRDGNYGGMG